VHMKRVLIVTDDIHARSWVHGALAGMDVALSDVLGPDIAERLMDGGSDLVISAGGSSFTDLVRHVEDAVARGVMVKLLVVVEAEGLAGLRLPVRVVSDLMVRSGSPEELAARVRMMLWPGEERVDAGLIRIEDLTLNLATYQAHTVEGPIDFTYQEYALFSFLVTHPNRAYSREALLSRVWGSDYYGGGRTVDVHVRRIRSKLGPELARRLQTIRGVGYLWQA